MNKLLLFLFLFCTSASAAELHLITDNIQITLSDTPCSSGIVLALLKPEAHKFYQDGIVVVGGTTTKLCWRVSPDQQQVWIVDEDGEMTAIPITAFSPKKVI